MEFDLSLGEIKATKLFPPLVNSSHTMISPQILSEKYMEQII